MTAPTQPSRSSAPEPIVRVLAAVMGDARVVHKGDTNTAQGFKFRGVDAVVNAVGPALRTHGVIVVPDVESVDYGTVEVGRNRTPMGHVRVKVRYTFHGPAGDSISCSVVAESMDSGDKATPKAMSVALRTALIQALCLPTDEPDPDSQSYERSEGVTTHRQELPQEAVAEARRILGVAARAEQAQEVPEVPRELADVDTRPWLTLQIAEVLTLGDGSQPVPLGFVAKQAKGRLGEGRMRSAWDVAVEMTGATS